MRSPLTILRGLSPLGPIFSKELRSTSRRKRTYVLRFLYIGALLLIMLAVYSGTHNELRYVGSVARRAQKLAELGAIFFAVFAFFSLFAMALAGPVLTATAINSERLHKTLPVLLMTPLSAWQIVAGKLFSRLLIALTLLGLSLPILAIVRLLGGVEIEAMFGVVCICVSLALFTASIGLLLSTLVSRAYSVILLAYAFLGVVYMFVPFAVIMIMSATMRNSAAGPGGMPRGVMTIMEIAAMGHPFVATMLLATPERPPFKLPSWEWCVLIHTALAGLFTLLAAASLRRAARRESESGGAAPLLPAALIPPRNFAPPTAQLAVEPGQIPLPAPTLDYVSPQTPVARQTNTRAVSDHPVLWRETRRPLFVRRWQSIAAGCVVLGFLVFVYVLMASNEALSEPMAQMPFAFILCAMLNLLACVLAATAIAQEKESDTWTLLLATPLSARSIVIGKLLGIFRRLAPFCLIIVIHFMLFWIGGVINATTLFVILYLTFATNVIWVATGLYLSLRIKRVTFAVMLNLAGPLVLYLLPLVLLAILFSNSHNDSVIETVGLYCPYPYMASAIDHWNGRYERSLWMPVYGNVSEGEFLRSVILAGFGHLLVSAAILWATIRRFDHIVERAPQQMRLSGVRGFPVDLAQPQP